MKPFGWSTEKNCLYIVFYARSKDYNYALYRIEMDDVSLFTSYWSAAYRPETISVPINLDLDEPLLCLGKEFPDGMGFFSYGSRIYMLGSGARHRKLTREVWVYDTVTSDFLEKQNMHTYKCQPIVIKPLKPYDDRVFVLSGDNGGHDLEVFYPEHDAWTYIGAPSYVCFQDYSYVRSHATVSDGFIIATDLSSAVFYYNIPKGFWRVITAGWASFLFLVGPSVFAYDVAKWFSFVDSSVGFLLGSCLDTSLNQLEIWKMIPLYLKHDHGPKYSTQDDLLYLGNLQFCLVRSWSDGTMGDLSTEPLPDHYVSVFLLKIDPACNVIECSVSSSYKIKQLDGRVDDIVRVCACLVI